MKKQIPNMCSILNACCGVMAILVALFFQTTTSIYISCLLILVGVFFDTIDGTLARNFHAESDMGKELDSFADLLTFGAAPVIVFLALHNLGHEHFHFSQIIIVTFYVACAMYRLARYNTSPPKDYFEGIPSTFSGLLLSLYIFVCNIFLEDLAHNLIFTIVSFTFIIILGCLMVSKIKINRIIKK